MYSSVYFQRTNSMIHWWEYDDQGEKQYYKEKAPLYFYIQNDEGEYTSIYGDKLRKVEFNTIGKMNDTRQMFKDAGRRLFESDVNTANRFILDNWQGLNLKKPENFDVHFLDIEVHSEGGFPTPENADHPITVITIWSTKRKKYFIFAENGFDTSFLKDENGHNPHWVKFFDSEDELLLTFIKFIKQMHPDILSGWNSNFFDIPYIVNRSNKLLGERKTSKLSPIGIVRKKKVKLRFGREVETYEIAGINCIDYMELYKKYSQGERESFKLDFIARIELDAQKLEYEGSLKTLYHDDWQKYIEYNVQDVNLLVRLDNKLQFMDMMIGICYNCRIPFEQYAITTKVLDGAFMSRLMAEKVVLPDVSSHDKSMQYIGAFVCDPDVGVHDWELSFDATSLYPSIMMEHNISPETKVVKVGNFEADVIMNILEGKEVSSMDRNVETDTGETCGEWADLIRSNKWSIASNGTVYRHDKQGIVPRFVEEWFNKRKIHKKAMIQAEINHDKEEQKLQHGLQLNYKILINSVYGYLGTEWSRMYDPDNATAVTTVGQECLKATIDSVNTYFKDRWSETKIGKKFKATTIPSTVVYGDTDSVAKNTKLVLEDGKEIEIQDLFDSCVHDDVKSYKRHYKDNREFVFPKDLKLPYYDGDVKYGNVQYIERHLIKKKMFRIKTKSGSYVDVTEDHSCMVIDSSGKMIEKPPMELKKRDKVIKLSIEIKMKYEIDEIDDIEYLGEICDDVYDIGMVDTPHTFFANDILVHNSVYLAIGRVLNSIGYDTSDIKKTEKFIDEKLSPLITKIIQNRMEHVALKRMNVPENKIFFKREMIARRGIHIAKKRYVAWVLNMEGAAVEEGSDEELEVKGVEIVRSSTPEIVRKYLKNVVTSIIKTLNEDDVYAYIKEVYNEFMEADPASISKNSTANNLHKYTDPFGLPMKGCPQHVKGAILYNKTLKEKELMNEYEEIHEGDKVKVTYVKPQDYFKGNCISFKDKIPEEFLLYDVIDYDLMWQKVFMKPLQQFYNLLKWEIPNCETEDIDEFFM